MPMLVGWIVTAVLWLFKNRIGFMILTILTWLGIAFASNTVVVQPIIDEIQAYVAGMGTEGEVGTKALAYLRYLKFDIALTMVFSAYGAAMALGAAKLHMVKRG